MRGWLAGCLLLGAAVGARAEYISPASPQSGGMRDIMLAYMGDDAWTADHFRPYVGFLDKRNGGKPRDWLFDSWLFLQFGGAPSGGAYAFGTATKTDWDHYLDLLYAPRLNLRALDDVIAATGRQLGDPDHVCPVIIMIPYLSPDLDFFGDVDGDGVAEDPANEEDLAKCYRWFVDAFLARWQPEAYPHLKLWGFYWMSEGVYGADGRMVRATGDYVRQRGYLLHWIPWFMAGGYTQLPELGFDFTVMQPNYAFMRLPEGATVPDENRLTRNANECRAYGMGVEMEMDSSTAINPSRQLNLQLYLNHGVDELDGYMNGAARAWYQALSFISELYYSDRAAANRLYEDIYRFHKGAYARRVVSLCEGAPCLLDGQPAPKLVDGIWMNRDGREDRQVVTAAPARIDLDLGAGQIVGDVRVHLATGADGQPPSRVRVTTSLDGVDYQPGAEQPTPTLDPQESSKAGFAIVTFAPRFARQVRIELDGPPECRLSIGEVIIFPARHLLWGAPGRISGRLDGLSEAGAVEVLTDGRLTASLPNPDGVRFGARQGMATLTLGEEWLLAGARAHVRWSTAAAPQMRVAAEVDGQQTYQSPWAAATGAGDTWVEVPLADSNADRVRFEVTGGAGVQWDEMQVVPAPNMAEGRPYAVGPSFEVEYPDSGGVELTDGVLTETGYSDGRTVGWFGLAPAVFLDLGSSKEISAVRVYSQGGGAAAVYYPRDLEVWGSDDADTWRLLGAGTPRRQVTRATVADGQASELAWLTLELKGAAARYLRVKFPANAWLMLSELEVLSGGANAAAGRAYSLQPKPHSLKPYADDGMRLTDGEASRPSDGWGKAVGWSEGQPEVIVDLLAPRTVSQVRAHVLGGGPGAVYFPLSMVADTSTDGAAWQPGASVPGPTDPGTGAALTAFIPAQFAPREARYVRVRLDRRNWTMVDEVQVFGPADRP